MRGRVLGQQIRWLEVCTSTRDVAPKLLAEEGLPHGAVVIASRQTAGRGTPGKAFLSDVAEGVWCTVVLDRPTPEPITLLAGVGVVRALAVCGFEAHVKWPNDVLVGRLKIAGCLAESGVRPDGTRVHLLSVGVNVLQESFDGTTLADIATSVRMAGGSATREEVFGALLEEIETLLAGKEGVRDAWLGHTRMIGRQIRVKRGGVPECVRVRDLDAHGTLIVEREDGVRERWVSAADLDIETDYAALDDAGA